MAKGKVATPDHVRVRADWESEWYSVGESAWLRRRLGRVALRVDDAWFVSMKALRRAFDRAGIRKLVRTGLLVPVSESAVPAADGGGKASTNTTPADDGAGKAKTTRKPKPKPKARKKTTAK